MWGGQIRAVAAANVDLRNPSRILDDVELQAGDMILLAGQKDARKNGIWRVSGYETGGVGIMKMPDRETPFRVTISDGLVNGGSIWEWSGKTWFKNK